MAHIWRETFSNMKYSGLVGMLSIIVVVLTAMMLGALFMIANYIHTELDVMRESPLVVAFLEDGLEDSNRQELLKEIEDLAQVDSVKYISKEDALHKTRDMFGNRAEILDGLEDMNPLPSSFEVELKPQFLDSTSVVADVLKTKSGIEDVQYAAKTSELVTKLETSLIFIGLILGLASIVIICFSIMITTYVRREEIKIMRLVGATALFIRIPLLLQGTMQGFLGSVIGLGVLYGLLEILATQTGPVTFLPLGQIILIIFAGTFMGSIAGAIPLRRMIRI